MPNLAQHPATILQKVLVVGHSGSGKTGALASLAKAGYNLRIIDFDNGCDVLRNLLASDRDALSRVTYETFTDKIKLTAGMPVVDGVPVAFSKAMDLLTHWKMPERKGPNDEVWPAYDLGKVTSWGPQDILIIDSLSLMCEAALRHVCMVNGRPNKPQIQDWGTMADMVLGCIELLYSTAIKCNVMVLTHIKMMGEEDEVKRGLPYALGQKVPVLIGRYFNSVIMVRSTGTGAATKRSIVTRPEGFVELKNSHPGKIPATLPLETGYADFFAMMRGEK